MGFDPSTNAAVLAALQNKVATAFPIQNANFQFVQASTLRLKGDSRYQLALPVDQRRTRTALAWSAVYRFKVMPGTLIVCQQGQEPLAEAMLLQEATDMINAMDLKILTQGGYSSVLVPGTNMGY